MFIQVVSVSLQVDSKTKTGFSSASVIIVLKRLKIYYYLNVFTQFLFLIAIGFMSLTFPVNNFRWLHFTSRFYKIFIVSQSSATE